MRNTQFRTWIAIIALNLLNFTQVVEAATVTLATSPLANATASVVRPNIMYVLDNSGSMNWDYLPDYVSDANSGGTGSSICWRGTSDTGTRSTCDSASTASSTPVFSSTNMTGNSVQIPLLTSNINYLYYDPGTYYKVPVKADGSSYPNSTVAAAYTDGFAATGSMNFQNATTIISTNGTRTNNSTNITGLSTTSPLNGSEGLLGSFVTGSGIPANTYVIDTPTTTSVTLSAKATSSGTNTLTFKTGAYPHQVYCNTTSVTNPQNLRGSNICKETSDTSVSSDLFPSATYSNAHSYEGVPYYYTMSPMQYCTDSVFTNCVYGSSDATHTVPAKYRWCNAYVSASQTFSGCQDLRNATHTIPDYLGGILPSPIIAVQAYADLAISSYIPGKSITGLTVNGTNVIGVNTFLAGSGGLTSTTAIATAICTAIQANTVTSGYGCTTVGPAAASGGLPALATGSLRIKANAPPAHASYVAPNGYDVVVTSSAPVTVGTAASGTLTITSTTGATRINDITVNGVSVMTPKPVYFPNGTSTTAIATFLAGPGVIGNGYVATVGPAANQITITSTGVGPNTNTIALTASGVSAVATVTANPAVTASGGSIGAITAGATILENAQSFAANLSTNNVATQIRNNVLGASGFTAISATNVTTFTAPAGNTYNGQTIAIAAGGIAATSPTGTLAITASGATRVDDITVNGVSVLATKPYFFGDTDTSATMCTKLATLITLNSFTAACAGSTLTFTAPTGTTYNGRTITMTGTPVSAKGTLTSTAAVGAAIGSTGIISSNGTTIQAAQSFPASSATTAVATQIRGASFQNGFSNGGGTGAAVIINAPPGNDFNNKAIVVAAGTTAGAGASSGTITITDSNTTTGVTNNSKINSLTCGGTNTINTNTVSAGSPGLIANLTTSLAANDANGYTISGCTAPTGSPQHAGCNITGPAGGAACTLAATLTTSPGFSVSGSLTAGSAATTSYTSFSQVAFASAGSGGSATATTNAGYDAASGAGTMNSAGAAAIPNYAGSLSGGTFPAAVNAVGSSAPTTGAGYAAQGATGSLMGSSATGVNPTGVITTNASATAPSTLQMGGGVDPVAAGRVHTGIFKRVDIVPSTPSYPKVAGRTDCAGATCTYAEELQNFANWFSYYRSRLLLMKTTSTLAFHELDSKYRVGFEKLSNYPSNSINLEVAQFVDSGGEVTNQRTNWWNSLTSTSTSGSTPLRSSVMKMGKYYGGKLTSAAAIPAVPASPASGTIQITSTTSNGGQITSITIQGVSMLGSTFTVSGCSSSCSSTQRSTVAGNLFSQITSSPGYAASPYTATRSSSTITFTAKTAGTSHNGDDIQVTKNSSINVSINDFTSGANTIAAIPAVVIEPLQYSCQQNFTLLVTDGYWNSDSYGDLTQLDGTTQIGNQDNVNSAPSARPYFDGGVSATAPCSDSAFSSCGTLADIAMYYYKTDLRDASLGNAISSSTNLDVSTNDVFKSPTDNNQDQHMVLFTMGLGAPGTLRYSSDYATAGSGDYYDIAHGVGSANWPASKANDPTTIDDLWHAAVNGRGKYFSARDPDSVVDGLTEALASIQVREGAAAAAATSNLQPIAGDNFAYVASYTTNEWSGDLQARIINTVSGAVSEPANPSPNDCVSDADCPWSAKKKLDSMDWTTRHIYMAPGSGSALRDFTYANLDATEKTYFNPSAGIAAYSTGPLSQYASVFATNPTEITAAKMIDFLRGDISHEEGNALSNPEVWRNRAHVLGDIVNTQPTFVRAPTATYQDSGYSAFVTAQADREGVVYVSANDGMLHAIAADDFEDGTVAGGTELWSFIPTEELPYLRYLADQDYVHRYFVDGQITVGDVNFGGGANDWHTILVGGLGGGGKSLYALDITDPVNPTYLWEFTHANLGYTYGNISFNKLPSGEWAVLFASGYNNASGEGLLYAVNPQTGALRAGYPISNGSGSAGSPSNLGKIAAWVDNVQANNTATEIYAGDMDGDLWRFNLTTKTVFKLAHLEDGSGNPQPITTRPEMTLNDGARIVYIGTGRYLGDLDPPDTSVQSFYAFTDTLGAPNLGGAIQETWNPRTDTGEFLQRKLIAFKNDGSQITRVDGSGNTVEARQICTGTGSQVSSIDGKCTNEAGGSMDWATMGGWYFDFPDSGERVNVDMNLTLGTLTIPSNVPASSACTSGGYGWVNYIDFRTGLEVDSTLIVSQKIANALIVGLNVIKIGDKLIAIVTTSDFNHDAVEPPGAPGKFKGRRDLWRELDPY